MKMYTMFTGVSSAPVPVCALATGPGAAVLCTGPSHPPPRPLRRTAAASAAARSRPWPRR